MYDVDWKWQVKKVKLVVGEDGSAVSRRIRIGFAGDLDAHLASALGSSAMALRTELVNHGIDSAKMAIDGVAAKAKLKGRGGEEVELDRMNGLNATATAAKVLEDEPEGEPQMLLEFDTEYTDAAWLFFGHNGSAWVDLSLQKRQLELTLAPAPKDEKPGEPTVTVNDSKPLKAPPRLKRGKLKTVAPKDDDPQEAETPEEAEAIRAANLAERGGGDEGGGAAAAGDDPAEEKLVF